MRADADPPSIRLGLVVCGELRRSKTMAVAAAAVLAFGLAAVLGPLIAPQDPADPAAALDLSNSRIPPLWLAGGRVPFWLGTDEQGRDMLSAVLYGLRTSLGVGLLGVAVSAGIGVPLGLAAGYFKGATNALAMRAADVQLAFPAILVALLLDGVARSALGRPPADAAALGILVASIGLGSWPQYARAVRGLAIVEAERDYVAAARLLGLSAPAILLRHVLPNVSGPVLVIAAVNLALAIATEATLSFLGAGLPPTMPSLGTLIRSGGEGVFSGDWWALAFPAATLAGLTLAVNLLGDGLRDALDPRLG
jgi:peptide/nickel transport system permease protein